MKAALITSFPSRFLEQKIFPALKRRGVEVVLVCEAKKAESYDLGSMRLDIVLHMNEMGGHPQSEKLSKACREAGLTVRALSRKTSSWSFLPPIPPGAVENDDEPEEADMDGVSDELAASQEKRVAEHAEAREKRLKMANDDLKKANEELRAANRGACDERDLATRKHRDDAEAWKLVVAGLNGDLAVARRDAETARDAQDSWKATFDQDAKIRGAARVLYEAGHLTADEVVKKFFLPSGAESGKRS